MIKKSMLEKLYFEEHRSMAEMAEALKCSVSQVTYWMGKHGLKRRSISDSMYYKNNPNRDPFSVQPIDSIEKAKLFGLGIGLYWGEGTKANKYAIRLGNSDPETFMKFLIELFKINKDDLKFGLQTFTDIDPEIALNYWTKSLDVKPAQFYRTHVTISGSIGTYKKKSEFGVVTLYYHKKKLRDILIELLPR